MKTLYIAALVILSSCNGFLKEYSQSDVRPGSVAELQEMMMGEAYPSAYTDASIHFGRYMELLTDDAQQADMSAFAVAPEDEQLDVERVAANGMGAFQWSPNMFETMDELGVATNTWQILYGFIKGCNVALDNVDKVTGSAEEKADLRGQALALRALYHWYLVNCFGQPVNAAGASASPGVPLILKSSVEDMKPRRNTVGEVYAQVERDLLEAAPLLEQHGQTKSQYRVTYEFACMMLSRIYLYQERWSDAALWAGKIIDRRPDLLDMAEVGDPFMNNVSCTQSPEAIWLYSETWEWTAYQFFNDNGVWHLSSSLIDSFETGDLRPSFWFAPAGYNYAFKSRNDYSSAGGKGMRVAEAYLNRAEALCEQALAGGGSLTTALADLNFLRQHRFGADDFAALSSSDPAALLKICREERRRELCWEEHRWFDLRRWGMAELRHQFQRRITGTPVEVVLPTADPRWTLPIPKAAIERNPFL